MERMIFSGSSHEPTHRYHPRRLDPARSPDRPRIGVSPRPGGGACATDPGGARAGARDRTRHPIRDGAETGGEIVDHYGWTWRRDQDRCRRRCSPGGHGEGFDRSASGGRNAAGRRRRGRVRFPQSGDPTPRAGGVGLALIFYSILEDREPNAIGLILLFVGIGFVVLWWFEERQIAPSGGSASGGAPGGPPPAA
jgi:hypothetical protein